MSQYRPVPPQVDLPAMEREILEFWDGADVFTKSLEQTDGGQPWTFYEGPPTANGMPGTHHIEARVFKDVFPRFRTMQGFHVDRKAGWDCHGLPVELAVERDEPLVEAVELDVERLDRRAEDLLELRTGRGRCTVAEHRKYDRDRRGGEDDIALGHRVEHLRRERRERGPYWVALGRSAHAGDHQPCVTGRRAARQLQRERRQPEHPQDRTPVHVRHAF